MNENGEIEGVKIDWDCSAEVESKPTPAPKPNHAKKKRLPGVKKTCKVTGLSADAPAPHTKTLIEKNGAKPTARALEAWAARVRGMTILDTAHEMGVSIAEAKVLIAEAHSAIAEDLKANVELNRQLDLDRIDGLLHTYYPLAKAGDTEAAKLVTSCVKHRATLTGIESLPNPGRNHPRDILVWVQQSLPNIHKLVDSLPLELDGADRFNHRQLP